jgi:hypothetical protein
MRKGNAMAEPVAEKLPLHHRAEIPMFILMVVLNLAIPAVLIDFLASAGSAGIAPPGRPCSCPGLSSRTCTLRWMTSPRPWA